MILAAVGDTPYNIVALLHIVAVVVAFAPAFVHPLLRSQVRSGGSTEQQPLLSIMAANARRFYGPALIVAGLLGIALVEMSDDVYSLTAGWVIAAIVIWVAMNGVLHGLISPSLRAIGCGQGTPSTERRLEFGSALLTLLFIVQLVLMIWQPGN